MKHIFIINPAAGKGNAVSDIESSIKAAAEKLDAEYEIYFSKSVGDAEQFVKSFCQASCGAPVNFYACGGDGTLNEVFNGVAGFEFASVGVVPIGTGNDFVKNFGINEDFFDIEAQICGTPLSIDGIRVGARFAINMVNMGFDCSVVETVAKIKRYPFISSKMAYIAGVIIEFLKMPGVKMKKMVIDGEDKNISELQLCAFAGGEFYGGGFHSAPRARLDDGMMDVCYIGRVSRLQFIKMIGSYKNGTHLQNKRTQKIVNYHKCKKVYIDFESERSVCIDGEITKMKSLDIEIVPNAFKFVLPSSVNYEKRNADDKILAKC